jgi:hypothetical protein
MKLLVAFGTFATASKNSYINRDVNEHAMNIIINKLM